MWCGSLLAVKVSSSLPHHQLFSTIIIGKRLLYDEQLERYESGEIKRRTFKHCMAPMSDVDGVFQRHSTQTLWLNLASDEHARFNFSFIRREAKNEKQFINRLESLKHAKMKHHRAFLLLVSRIIIKCEVYKCRPPVPGLEKCLQTQCFCSFMNLQNICCFLLSA